MWRFWELADGRGGGEFSAWRSRLSKAERGVLDEKLRALKVFGPLKVGFWRGVTGYGRINKLHITTPAGALRPLVCRGPIEMNGEVTLLLGAKEDNFDWDPPQAPERADALRKSVIAKTRLRVEYKVPGV